LGDFLSHVLRDALVHTLGEAAVDKQWLAVNGVDIVNLIIPSLLILILVIVFLLTAVVDHVLHGGLAIHLHIFLHA
jgi:hypothetical protein